MSTRPNLLVVISDQQRADSVGALGCPVPATPHLDELANRGTAFADALEPADWAEITATYLGMVSRLDEQVGRLRAALCAAGLDERTVTFFCSDHGEYLGDYGGVEKWPSGLDACLVRTPLIVAGPGVAEGVRADTFVELIDLPATWWELAEVEVDHVHFGRSLVPTLGGSRLVHRDRAFSEGGFRRDEEPQNEIAEGHPYGLKAGLQHERPELVARAVCLRTAEWTYVRRAGEGEELYDRGVDRAETTNVADRPDHAAVLAAQREEVLDWLVATSDVIPTRRDPRMEPDLVAQLLAPS